MIFLPGKGRGQSVLLISFVNVLQGRDEVIQDLRRDHDAVAVGAHFLSDAHHSTSRVALQVNEECFAIGDDLFCAYNVVLHCVDAGWLFIPALVILASSRCRVNLFSAPVPNKFYLVHRKAVSITLKKSKLAKNSRADGAFASLKLAFVLFSPESFEAVEVANFGGHNVNHDINVIKDGPEGLGGCARHRRGRG